MRRGDRPDEAVPRGRYVGKAVSTLGIWGVFICVYISKAQLDRGHEITVRISPPVASPSNSKKQKPSVDRA
jgi:hypothetical protein